MRKITYSKWISLYFEIYSYSKVMQAWNWGKWWQTLLVTVMKPGCWEPGAGAGAWKFWTPGAGAGVGAVPKIGRLHNTDCQTVFNEAVGITVCVRKHSTATYLFIIVWYVQVLKSHYLFFIRNAKHLIQFIIWTYYCPNIYIFLWNNFIKNDPRIHKTIFHVECYLAHIVFIIILFLICH